MSDAREDGQNRVRGLLDRIAFSRTEHLASLLEAAKSALANKRPYHAWLAADRLFRISGSADAAPLLLRSAAHAALGHADAARADFDHAARLDPAHPLIVHSLLRSADPSRRRKGAASAFQSMASIADATAQAALATLARDSVSAALAETGRDELVVRLWWTEEQAPHITITDGERHWPIEAQLPGGDPHPGYRHHAEAHFAWPDGVDALKINAPAETFVAPDIILRPTLAPPSDAGLDPIVESPASCLVILPIYGDAASARSCIESLGLALPSNGLWRVIVVDDAGPDPAIRALIAEIEHDGRFTLVKNPFNLGFAASVNRALRQRRSQEDVLLLNSDVILPPGAIERLAAVAGQDRRIGTVTPLSNNGEDTSLPKRFAANPLPPAEQITRLDALASQVNRLSAVDLANGVGFCLFMTAAALDAAGPLPTTFGRGYYEDVAFCLKAAEAGFRNVCATGVYVGHVGSRSFRHEKRALIRRNLARLITAFPQYASQSARFERDDPLLPAVRRIERAELAMAGGLRLVIVPQDCPQPLAERLAAAMPGASPRTLFVIKKAALFALRGAGGAMPQNLDLDAREWRGVAAALALSGRVTDIVLIDPAALPAVDATGLLTSSAKLFVVHASSLFAGCETPAWVPENHVSFSADALLGAAADDQDARPVSRNINSPSPSRRRWVAIRAPLPSVETRALLATLSTELRREQPDLDLVFLGRDDNDFHLMQELGIWVTGEMTVPEIAPFLATGSAGLVLIDRAYGLASDELRHALKAGVPTACFDPQPAAHRRWFALDPAADDGAVSAALIAWLRRLQQGPNDQAGTDCRGEASMASEEV